MKTTSLFALASSLFIPTLALQNGVGRLPTLGYNTWNAYQCNIDEDLMLTTAQLMKSLGLQAAGYNYVNIDDCYAERNRSSDGNIIADKVRFKGGMKHLTDKIHALGFDSGWFTCAGYPGSFQNELRDARTFQDWGFDYLKCVFGVRTLRVIPMLKRKRIRTPGSTIVLVRLAVTLVSTEG
ncbi:hypothetical protein PTI98_008894 [Pleurotus ostreatus]|nr:hypothetical protein PTI98_008894 [Pleurotus ostreatus]